MNTSINHETRIAGQVAALAPSASDVSRAWRGQWLALAIYGIPLILLMIGLYVRLFASAERLGFEGIFGSIFAYLFPLIVVTVLAALLWALVVEPSSRGNTLGDHLRSQEQVDDDTVRRDEELLAAGRESVMEAKKHAEAVRAALLSADEEIADMAEVGHRGLQIAHAALGVGTIGRIRPENMITQTFPQRQRIERAVEVETARSERSAEALEQDTLPGLEPLDSPHFIYTAPPSVVPDLAFVVPATMAPYKDSTLGLDDEQEMIDDGRQPRNRRAIIGAALAALLLAGAMIYLLTDRSPAVASVGTTATSEDSHASGATPTTDEVAPTTQSAPRAWT